MKKNYFYPDIYSFLNYFLLEKVKKLEKDNIYINLSKVYISMIKIYSVDKRKYHKKVIEIMVRK